MKLGEAVDLLERPPHKEHQCAVAIDCTVDDAAMETVGSVGVARVMILLVFPSMFKFPVAFAPVGFVALYVAWPESPASEYTGPVS
jgi:hypothetical protein